MAKKAKGGLTKGPSHAKGGIKMEVGPGGDIIEVEGGEGVLNSITMDSDALYDFNGKKLTACQIASELNQTDGNGVKFSCDNNDNLSISEGIDREMQELMEKRNKGGKVKLVGGEGIINKYVMAGDKKYKFQGKELTACEILSELNQVKGDGKKFNCAETKNTDMTPTDPQTGFAKGGETKKDKRGKFMQFAAQVKKEEGLPYREAQKKASKLYKEIKAKGGTIDDLLKKQTTPKSLEIDAIEEVAEESLFDKGGKAKKSKSSSINIFPDNFIKYVKSDNVIKRSDGLYYNTETQYRKGFTLKELYNWTQKEDYDFAKGGKINWIESKKGKGDPSIVKRNEKVKNAALDYGQGDISFDEYLEIQDKNSPIQPITKFFTPATEERMKADLTGNAKGRKEDFLARGKRKVPKSELVNAPVYKDERVALRLDIPAYKDKNSWIVSIHDGSKKMGDVWSYQNVARITDVNFETNPNAALAIASGKASKTTVARMYGKWQPFEGSNSKEKGESAMRFIQDIKDDPTWIQIGMNPFRHSYFYDREDGQPVISADDVVQVGGLVYAKNAIKTTPYNDKFKVNNPIFPGATHFAKGGELSEYVYFKSKAKKESKDGYVVHVNMLLDKEGDIFFRLSDFYDSNETIATYENGKTLLETNFDSKQDMLEWIDDNKDYYAKGGDINDPVLIRARASRDRYNKELELERKLKNKHGDIDFFDSIDLKLELKELKERRNQLLIDMEQEAEPEGGKIANEYGNELNKIDERINNINEKLSLYENYAKGGVFGQTKKDFSKEQLELIEDGMDCLQNELDSKININEKDYENKIGNQNEVRNIAFDKIMAKGIKREPDVVIKESYGDSWRINGFTTYDQFNAARDSLILEGYSYKESEKLVEDFHERNGLEIRNYAKGGDLSEFKDEDDDIYIVNKIDNKTFDIAVNSNYIYWEQQEEGEYDDDGDYPDEKSDFEIIDEWINDYWFKGSKDNSVISIDESSYDKEIEGHDIYRIVLKNKLNSKSKKRVSKKNKYEDGYPSWVNIKINEDPGFGFLDESRGVVSEYIYFDNTNNKEFAKLSYIIDEERDSSYSLIILSNDNKYVPIIKDIEESKGIKGINAYAKGGEVDDKISVEIDFYLPAELDGRKDALKDFRKKLRKNKIKLEVVDTNSPSGGNNVGILYGKKGDIKRVLLDDNIYGAPEDEVNEILSSAKKIKSEGGDVDNPNQLFFIIRHRDGEALVEISKDYGDSKYYERFIAGDKPYNFGYKTYQSYLSPSEIEKLFR